MQKPARHFYAFGPFQLDSQERILRRNGQPVSLTPKAVDILLLLVQNAEHLVDKDELMRQVWPDAFVEESNLTKNISVLRKTLGASENGQEYIETKPRRGYWFAGHVETWDEDEQRRDAIPERHSGKATLTAGPLKIERIDRGRGYALAGQAEPIHEVPDTPAAPVPVPPAPIGLPRQEAREDDTKLRQRRWVVGGLAGALAAIVALAVWAVLPVPSPRVLRTVQLTHFGRLDNYTRLVTDGTHFYVMERRGGQGILEKVAVEGGEPVAITTQLPDSGLLDISPDHSELLVRTDADSTEVSALWILPTSGEPPLRLGSVIAHSGAWSPDGLRIVYTAGSDLYVVKSDGSESRKLIGTAGTPEYPRWSPDGRLVRFTVMGMPAAPTESIWEITAEGRNLHRLLPGWRESPTSWGDGESGGDWTPDGKYFVFRSVRAHAASIWAIRERAGFLRSPSSAPVLLTTSDLYVWNTLVAGNGKRVLFGGSKDDRELLRYEARSNQFVPYLSGISARRASFTRDGQWVAYVVVPGSVLWRGRVDGGDRLQLTFPPMTIASPRWSPDGKHIAYIATRNSGVAFPGPRVYLLSRDGENPEVVTPEEYRPDDPDWSPDGSSLLFSSHPQGGGSETWAIFRIDLKTRKVSQLPGSQGLRAPAFSPDGKYVAATSVDPPNRLMLFDVQAGHWTELAQANAFYVPPYWSRDDKYVYAQDIAGVDEPLYRVRISDHKREVVTTLKQFARADATAYTLEGLTPEGEPLASVLRSSSDIYALDVDFP